MLKHAFSICLIGLLSLASLQAQPACGFERRLAGLERKLRPIDPAYGPEVRASGLVAVERAYLDFPVKPRFTFNPSKIALKHGELVAMVLASGGADHGFRVPEANLEVAIPAPGMGEARVRFAVDRKGQFVFECSRPWGSGDSRYGASSQ